jgi:hypothetical protein
MEEIADFGLRIWDLVTGAIGIVRRRSSVVLREQSAKCRAGRTTATVINMTEKLMTEKSTACTASDDASFAADDLIILKRRER